MKTSKMSYKRAILVALPFFAITIFWQAYDTLVPQMLAYHFGMNSTVRGLVMGIDNLVALIFLPLFGALSDKINSRLGRRTPLIIIGTIGGVLGFIGMTIADNIQLSKLDAAGIPEAYNSAADAGAKAAIINQAAEIMKGNIGTIVLFMIMLLIAVFLMSIFRSPATALVADLFVRPHRSKANAMLNIMGGMAGIVFLVMNAKMASVYGGFFKLIVICTVFMIIGVLVYTLTIREPKLARQVQEDNIRLGYVENTKSEKINEKLSPEVFKSLCFILAVVAFMYMGYNATSTHFSVYAINNLGMTSAEISKPLLVRVVSVLIFCIPSAMLSSKIGRKKTTMAGLAIVAVTSIALFFVTPESNGLLTPIFLVYGMGFAFASVNVGPMVIELCSDKDTGRYMGYYYLASTIAQIITPSLGGFVMDNIAEAGLFIYTALFMMLGFITCFFIKHGDCKPVNVNAVDVLGADEE